MAHSLARGGIGFSRSRDIVIEKLDNGYLLNVAYQAMRPGNTARGEAAQVPFIEGLKITLPDAIRVGAYVTFYLALESDALTRENCLAGIQQIETCIEG